MRRFFILLLFFAVTANAQQVPSKMTVAGVKLSFSDRLRSDLQKEVDALTVSPKYFKIKVDRAKIYFPIIEHIFAQENVPDDIKYLVLQESALIPDAVSVSNAVGYWQFKDFTAMEVGLRVDKQVDERMHIISSTRGAALYLKKNNEFFNNWIYAIQAYQMGAGGALRVVDKKNYGAAKMDLDHNTYWYVKKFIAHKIAFESAVDGEGEITLDIYEEASNKSLEQVAREMSVDYEQLRAYNAWLRKGRIPDDKIYPVLLPFTHRTATPLRVKIEKDEPSVIPQKVIFTEESKFPVSGSKMPLFSSEEVQTFNDIPGIKAKQDQTLIMLAAAGDVSLGKFLKVNDIDVTHRPQAGQVYYFKRKKSKAGTHYHIVKNEETLWDVSQRYGVRVKKLLFKNRLDSEKDVKPGLVLWLRHVRPNHIPAEYKDLSSAPKPAIELPAREPVQNIDTTVTIESDSTDSSSGDSVIQEENITASASASNLEDEVDEELTGADDMEEKHFIWHVVRPKETLYSLAKLYNVQVVDILRWNRLNVSDKLAVGREVKILQQKAVNDQKEIVNLQDDLNIITHEVQPGETFYQLARKYEVTVEDLLKWNNKNDYNLSPGDKLVVKKVK